MNSQHKVLCTHCGKLIPVAESDAHCATHEKTPIPAVASERERVAIELERICCAWDDHLGECTKQTILKAADLLQRAQADALDARLKGIEEAANWVRDRHDAWFRENGYIEPDTNAASFGRGPRANAKEEYDCELTEIEEGIRALRTSSPDFLGRNMFSRRRMSEQYEADVAEIIRWFGHYAPHKGLEEARDTAIRAVMDRAYQRGVARGINYADEQWRDKLADFMNSYENGFADGWNDLRKRLLEQRAASPAPDPAQEAAPVAEAVTTDAIMAICRVFVPDWDDLEWSARREHRDNVRAAIDSACPAAPVTEDHEYACLRAVYEAARAYLRYEAEPAKQRESRVHLDNAIDDVKQGDGGYDYAAPVADGTEGRETFDLGRAIERVFTMGQNYWADADSESYKANKRSDVTLEKFRAFKAELLDRIVIPAATDTPASAVAELAGRLEEAGVYAGFPKSELYFEAATFLKTLNAPPPIARSENAPADPAERISEAAFDAWTNGLDLTPGERRWAGIAWITCSRRARGMEDDDRG